MDKEKDEVKFSIEGNPGQNNTFVHIGKAIHVNNNPGTVQTTVIISAEGDEWEKAALREAGIEVPEKKKAEEKKPEEIVGLTMSARVFRQKMEEGVINKDMLKREIMKYVEAIREFVKDEKNNLYTKLWEGILVHKAFAFDIYYPGKQESKFNRNLVGNILHYLAGKGFYEKDYNASAMTCAYADVLAKDRKDGLNKGADDPARKGLREDLALKYQKAVDEILNELSS